MRKIEGCFLRWLDTKACFCMVPHNSITGDVSVMAFVCWAAGFSFLLSENDAVLIPCPLKNTGNRRLKFERLV